MQLSIVIGTRLAGVVYRRLQEDLFAYFNQTSTELVESIGLPTDPVQERTTLLFDDEGPSMQLFFAKTGQIANPLAQEIRSDLLRAVSSGARLIVKLGKTEFNFGRPQGDGSLCEQFQRAHQVLEEHDPEQEAHFIWGPESEEDAGAWVPG